jgi:hypothetical protein
MTKSEFDEWWVQHPQSASLAASRYRPTFCETDDFRSELYLHCRALAETHNPEHPVSHWLCREAIRLREAMTRRAQREIRDWRVPVVSLSDPVSDDDTVEDMIAAADRPVDEIIDLERAMGRVQLSETQRAALRGAVEDISDGALGKLLGLSGSRIRHARVEARRILCQALGS